MQNPCRTCLLVTNCTAICEAKENLRTLLKQTLHTYQIGVRFTNTPSTDYIRRHNFWQKLKRENDAEIMQIRLRALKLKRDNI